jgi:hypothetical protein
VLHTILKKVSRGIVVAFCVWLPEEKKVQLERWLRGRSEYRELRRAEVVVAAFGKSGRTWLRVMLSAVIKLTEGDTDGALLSARGSAGRRASRPGIFFTHDNYIQDYTGNRDSKAHFVGRRVLLLVRDPRDVTVSQYFQWKHRMKRKKTRVNRYPPKGTEVAIYDFLMDPGYGLVRCIDFLNLWAREAEQVSDRLIIRYEDLRREPVENLSRIVKFLGLEASREVIEQAVEESSVENMRKIESSNTSIFAGGRMKPGDRDNADSYKVRRAKVGGYRDYFSDDEVAQIDAYVEEHLLPDFGYTNSHPSGEGAASSRNPSN